MSHAAVSRQLAALTVLALHAVVLSGCGGSADRPTLDVSVTATLQGPFATIAKQYDAATIKLTYGSVAELAAAVRAGGGGDLIVSTDLAAMNALSKDGLIQPPAVFGSDQVMIAYHAGAGVTRFPNMAALVGANLPLEAPNGGSDFAAAVDAALAALPRDQGTALQARITNHASTSQAILADVISGKAAAGLVLKSELTSMVRQPPSEWAGLGGWLEFGPLISYNAAVVNPSGSRRAGRAQQQAAAVLLFQLLQGEQTPARILRSDQIGAPPSTRPYAPPSYTPTGNQYPTGATQATHRSVAPTYRFTPSPASTP